MEARKVVLFGGHGIGIANNKKQSGNMLLQQGPFTNVGDTWRVDLEDRRGAQWHHLSRCRKADTPGRSWTETLTDLVALQTKDKHAPLQDDGPKRAPGKKEQET
ncbi:unnamed protein product [Arctogadus glacialis]